MGTRTVHILTYPGNVLYVNIYNLTEPRHCRNEDYLWMVLYILYCCLLESWIIQHHITKFTMNAMGKFIKDSVTQWFSLGTLVSSTNKTEILLKVVLNTITLTIIKGSETTKYRYVFCIVLQCIVYSPNGQ